MTVADSPILELTERHRFRSRSFRKINAPEPNRRTYGIKRQQLLDALWLILYKGSARNTALAKVFPFREC
jgi:hypothetical protein